MDTVRRAYNAENISSDHKNGDTSSGYLVTWEEEWESPVSHDDLLATSYLLTLSK